MTARLAGASTSAPVSPWSIRSWNWFGRACLKDRRAAGGRKRLSSSEAPSLFSSLSPERRDVDLVNAIRHVARVQIISLQSNAPHESQNARIAQGNTNLA